MKTRGTRQEVWDRKAQMTSSGFVRTQLMKNASGSIVPKKNQSGKGIFDGVNKSINSFGNSAYSGSWLHK